MGKEYEIEKLRGSENYLDWVFAIQNYLAVKSLSDCITSPAKEKDETKLIQCKAILVLNIDSKLYKYVRSCDTALEVWTSLKNKYEETGTCRRITLLQSLVSCKLENYDSVAEFTSDIVELSQKLNGIGFEVSDMWLGAILLAGLPSDYKPFIMGLQASGAKLEPNVIIAQLEDFENNEKKGEALFTRNKGKKGKVNKHRDATCDHCNKKGHIQKNCFAYKKLMKEESTPKGNAHNAFCAFLSTDSQQNSWYLDSGASSHMTPDGRMLKNMRTPDIKSVVIASNKSLQCEAKGEAVLKLNESDVEIKNVLHIPELGFNLLSISKMAENDNTIIFNKAGCEIKNANNETLAFVKPRNGVYCLNETVGNMSMISKNEETAMLWHRRLGHIGQQNLLKMKNGLVDGVVFNDNGNEIKNCVTCCESKQTRLPFDERKRETTDILQLIHSDVMGPMETQSLGGAKYIVSFVDDYSKKVYVYFIRGKDEVFGKFKEFRALVENQMNKRIKILRSDNGKEYMSNDFDNFCKTHGIRREMSTPYTPQQNGVAERMNRTLVEKAKCLLFDAKLKKAFWAEAVNMAAYLINRCPSKGKIPDEVFYNKRVDVSTLKLFGCEIMVHVPKEKRRKWDKKSTKMLFVGFDENRKAYRCIHPSTCKLYVSRDVIFRESVEKQKCSVDIDTEIQVNDEQILDNSVINILDDTPQNAEIDGDNNEVAVELNESTDDVYDDPDDSEYAPDEELSEAQPRTIQTRSKAPKSHEFQLTNFAFLSTDPLTVAEINRRDDKIKWHEAMQDEMKSHAINDTWKVCELPSGQRTVKSKWVFKAKKDEHGNIIRHKARLVAMGYSQRPGVDYNETFCPVVRYSSIRMLVAVAVKENLEIYQMDAITAFLQGELEETLYMDQPEGFGDGTKRVCKLNKAIYGLKQAGHQWNVKLDTALLKFGLLKGKSDPCVYYTKNKQLLVAIYVDDFLIFHKDHGQLNKLKMYLHETFKMKDVGAAKSCIGININQSKGCIEMDQRQYIIEMLEKFGMTDCNPAGTPTNTSIKLSANMVNQKNDLTGKIPYQEAIGSLLFLAQATRADISFAVNDASRFNNKHGAEHWIAVKRIFRYLKGTMDFKLRYTSEKGNLVAFTDSDWGSDIDKRRSCTGYVIKLSNAAVIWHSKRQAIVALSSTEAEYIALSSCVCEVMWAKQFLAEICNTEKKKVSVMCDNQSAIKLSDSEAYRPRTKHIDIRFHHIRDQINNDKVEIKFVPSAKMTADALTKAVTKDKHLFCAKEMGISA